MFKFCSFRYYVLKVLMVVKFDQLMFLGQTLKAEFERERCVAKATFFL